MTLRIDWQPEALEALEAITEYIAERNPSAAIRLGDRILDLAETLLPGNPQIGRPAAHDTRELVVHKNYVLAYRLTSTTIQILAIRHAARHHR